MFTISKAFLFSAAHHLDGLPEDHPCSRPHGHNYTVELELRASRLDDVGFVVDYRALDRFKKWIDDTVDHRDLNEIIDFNPSAELLGEWFYEVARSMGFPVSACRVKETEKTCAEFRP